MPRRLSRRGGISPGSDALPSPSRPNTFEEMMLPSRLVRGLSRAGLEAPSPVQQLAIPLGRFGADVIAQAKSGTGKSAAFATILVEKAYEEGIGTSPGSPRALLLAPTREIVQQADRVLRAVGDEDEAASGGNSNVETKLCHAFVGGKSELRDREVLQRGVWLACVTPGRARALITRGWLRTEAVQVVVLDEADALMGGDMLEDVQWILDSLPSRRQIMAFSATYPPDVLRQLEKRMRFPQKVMLCEETVQLQRVRQFIKVIEEDGEKENALIDVLNGVAFHQAIVFCNTKTYSAELAERLVSRGVKASSITADLKQDDRQRVLDKFHNFHLRVLVSTDLLARGVDLHHVNLVVNMDLPRDGETYLHRIGRAGRFASPGLAVSILTADQLGDLRQVVEKAGGETGSLEVFPEYLSDEEHMYELEH